MPKSSSDDEIPDTPRERSTYMAMKSLKKLKSCESSTDKKVVTCRPPTPVPLSEHSSDEFDLQWCVRLQSHCSNKTTGKSELQSDSPKHVFRKLPISSSKSTFAKDSSTPEGIVANAACKRFDSSSKTKLAVKNVNTENASSRSRKLAVSSSDSDGEIFTRCLQAKKCTKMTRKSGRNTRCRSLSLSDKEEDINVLQTRKRKIHRPLSENAPDSFIDELFSTSDNRTRTQHENSSEMRRINRISRNMSLIPTSQNLCESVSMLQVPREDCQMDDIFCQEAPVYLINERIQNKPGTGKADGRRENNSRPIKFLDQRKQVNPKLHRKSSDSAFMDFALPANWEFDPSNVSGRDFHKPSASGSPKPEILPVINDSLNTGACAKTYSFKKYKFKRVISVDEKAENDDRRTSNVANSGLVNNSSAAASAGTSSQNTSSELPNSEMENGVHVYSKPLSKETKSVKDLKASSVTKGKTSKNDRPSKLDLIDTDSMPHCKKIVTDGRLNRDPVRRRHPPLIDDETTECLTSQNDPHDNHVSYIEIDSDNSSDDSKSWKGIGSTQHPANNPYSGAGNVRLGPLRTKELRVSDDSGRAYSRKKRGQVLNEGSRRASSLSSALKHSVENLSDDLVLITEITGISDRKVIEAAVSRVSDHHGFYYINDIIDYLLSDDREQENWRSDSIERMLGSSSNWGESSSNSLLVRGSQQQFGGIERNECLRPSSTNTIDPSYATMMCERINQFTDYQWQVHVALHDGADVPPSPEYYCGPSPDSLVDSEVLQYMVHCRESGLPLPHRGPSVERPGNRRTARIHPWRSRHVAAHGGVETARGVSSEPSQTMAHVSSRPAHSVLRANRRQRQDRSNGDADESTSRLRTRISTRPSTTSETTSSSATRTDRPVVGRAQRQTDTPWDSFFQHIYDGFMGGSRGNRDTERRATSFRRPRRRPRVRSPSSWDLDDYDGLFSHSATRQPDAWSRNVDRQVSLLSRTHLLDMAESNDMMDEELDELGGRVERIGSRIRGLHGHLSLISRTHLLDMDESDDVSDEYEHLLSIIERVGDAVPRGLDSSAIRQLPTKSFSLSEVKEGESSPECNICICEYVEGDRLRILQCLHRFHAKCIDKWLSENRTCPICRVEVHV